MFKKHLLKSAIELYRKEMCQLQDERKLFEEKERDAFNRFLERCDQIEEMSFLERFKDTIYGGGVNCDIEGRIQQL